MNNTAGTREEIKRILSRIDGRGYKAYRDLKGCYDYGDFELRIDHVQSDPFASPSRFRAIIPGNKAGFPRDVFSGKSRETGLRDFLCRLFAARAKRISKGGRGTGKSGLVLIDSPGQEVLERTAIIVKGETIEARFRVGLPARGRTVLAKVAATMLINEIPVIIRDSLFYRNLDAGKLKDHVETTEDADFLREALDENGLISFIADGSVLPRASGIDKKPLKTGRIIRFKSPSSMRVSFTLPNRGLIHGMGIRKGVTLIVGGGYHGKSTLLDAVKLGVYNHVPGDGREFAVTVPDTVMIRSEDGRRVEGVDISPFISNLPYGQDTFFFSTENASGSTSQAANIMEALESGARALLIDEDMSATNFMIRDHRMQELITKELEPITPFIDKVRYLYLDHGVSTILVIGGSGDYFDVADNVISMKEYVPGDCTAMARSIAQKFSTGRKGEGGETFGSFRSRIPLAGSFDPGRGNREVRISTKGPRSIAFGKNEIDLGAVEQLVDISQTNALGEAINYARKYMDNKRTIREVIDLVMSDISGYGPDVLNRIPLGEYAVFRNHELAAAINRLRTIKVVQEK